MHHYFPILIHSYLPKIQHICFLVTINKLEDIHEVLNDKWREIGKCFYNTNFQTKVRIPRDLSKLNGIEKTLCIQFLKLIEQGSSLTEIKDMYILPYDNHTARWRMTNLFERIAYFATVDNEHTKEIKHTFDLVKKWDQFFGFNI